MEPKILLVDDEPEAIEAIQRSLRREPYELLAAHSGQAALDILSAQNVDVLVSDEVMPGMSGAELMAQVRRQYPDIIRIMLTGQASVESAMNAIYDSWVFQYLHKPVAAADLASTIHNALLMKAARSDSESAHLMMSSHEQNLLLADVSRKTSTNMATEPSSKNGKLEVCSAVESIRSAIERAANASSIDDFLTEVRTALKDIEIHERR